MKRGRDVDWKRFLEDVKDGARASWASNPWVWAIIFRRVKP